MKKNYKNYIKIICFLFFSILSAQMKGQHFNFEGGNAVDPVWIIFFQEVTLGDIDLEAGDEIAVFDGSTMVGALTLTQVCTPVNFFENDLAAFSTVNSGPGYTSGNPVSFKCWDASQEIESASFSISFEDPYGVAWTQSVFPSGDGEYSVVHLSFDWTYVGSLAGTITNAENSQPIEGAFVTVEGTSYNATTIANGTYLIEDIETGIYSVTANAAGYYPETIAGVEVFSEETTTVAFNLLPVFPSQYYNLTQGYQLISSRLISGNPDMQNIFQNNLDNLEFVRNTAGFMLQKIGPVWVNNIGDWINTEGYLIKMSSADQLAITGPAIDPQTPITLTTGYQIIGYLPVQAVNAEDVFYNILESLEFVRNTAGFMFQKIGPVWVNNIGDMQPGEGYLVYMNSDNVLIYPAFSSFTCGDPFTDSRNGQIYQTALIGEQCWMAENLNIGTMINGNEEMADNSEIEKYCYENNTVNCDDYGGLYQWNEMMQYVSDTAVQGICPDGWYIPTDHEWKLLEGTVDSQYPVGHQVWNNTDWRGFDAGLNLKSATAWNGTDLFQFAGLSGGSRNYDGNFYNTDVFAFFWSSTEDDNSLVWDRRLHNTYGGVARYQSGEGFGFSVRCLKDETIQINMPPQAPSSPSPEHEAINQSIEVDLSWTCTDPEADPLNYDIYFGTEATPPQIATAQTEITFDPGTLEYNTEYFWKIIAHDYYNNTTEGPVWSFTTEVNLSPESPSSPSPEHESENQSIEVDLSWTCTDPEGDPLAYDIYFGTEASPPQVATSQTETTFDPGTLESHIEYYWKIVAHDDHSNTTEGPIWSFITEAACGEPFIDPRDGQTYNSILIGGQCWMAENLNIGNMINSSQNQQNNGNIEKYCYGNNPTYCNNFGGLYQWNEMMQYTTTPGVQGICPAGWHIPTDDEWKILEGTVDSQYPVGHPIWNSTGWRGYNAGLNLKTTNGWNGNNYYGFSALPGGYRDPGGSFNGFSEYAYFYSSLPSGSGAWSRALASGYSTVFRNIVNQDAGCSIRCLKDVQFQCGDPLTDARDQQTYETVQIDSQCWMAENLNIGNQINCAQNMTNNSVIEKYCYGNSSGNCNEYGGLYQWDEMMQYTTTPGVQGICPAGWHLPTDGELTTLTDFLGGESVAGGKMKETGTVHWQSPNTGATNESGFTALPGGLRHTIGSCNDLTSYAYFWSSSESNSNYVWYRSLLYFEADVYRFYYDKIRGFSVRCVQD